MGHLQKKEKEIITELNANDPKACSAFHQMLAFFELYDALEHSNHSKTLWEIYLSRQNYGKGNVALMFATNLGENTFYTHRRKYLKCFDLLLNGNFAWQEAAVTSAPTSVS